MVKHTFGSSLFGAAPSADFTDFTSLASAATGSGFKTAGEGFQFAGAGSSLFGSQVQSTEGEEGDGDDNHDPHFEPIVPLPELVEVSTGEEEEMVVFKHRAKVYRYCSDTKQWKERGVGDIKILKHNQTGVTRVLLRRDQVFMIALNHRITKEMELKPLASSETAWCWFAMDFSEGHEESGSLEQLAVLFKGKEVADDFKAKFEESQQSIGQSPSKSATFKVEFSSDDIVAEFKDMFAEGKDLAEQSEILETVGDQDPNDYYYGQGADGAD